jgi:general L-amino acid transport system permease protein
VGWKGFILQVLFVVAVAWIAYAIVDNVRSNLATQRIAAGFGFLSNNAGFDVNQSLIPYNQSDTYARVFVVGLLNTLLVSVIGIFFATLIGFLVGLGRLSPNWLLSRVSGGYVELLRNIPLLFQILFWYLAVLGALPSPRQSISLFGVIFLSNRGLVVPTPIAVLCAPATVSNRPDDKDLAHHRRSADRIAAARLIGVRCSRRL